MRRKPIAFMSYAHVDNQYGQLSEFRERLSNEVHVQTGQEFRIFQDRDDILLGQNWRQRIEEALEEEVTSLIPIITPSFFNSGACREEFELFLDRERTLKRNDLILPVYYVSCRILDDEVQRAHDPLAEAIASRQWVDWRGLRFEQFTSPQVGKALMQLAGQVSLALERIHTQSSVSPRAGGNVATKSTTEATKSTTKAEIFMAYAHEDERLRDQLEKHLALLKRQGLITAWHDRKIFAGIEWASEIDAHLNSADIILFLVSAEFLASDYCYDIEMKRALERHSSGEARVIPIILRPCDWGGAPFAKLQALPKDARPITSWANRAEAFTDVARGIKSVIEGLYKNE
jgi:hypothetical protein